MNVSDGLSSDSLILSVYVDRLCTDTLIGFNVCLEGESTGGVTYDRDNDYNTWKDWDNDCQSNRHEVLIDEHDSSTGVGLTYTSDTNCMVATGRWYDQYTNQYLSLATEAAVRHFVPLSESHRSGAWAWSRERKTIYANTLNVPEQLNVSQVGVSQDPSGYIPENEKCNYLKNWVKVKSIYRLGINNSEEEAITSAYESCGTSTEPIFTVSEADSEVIKIDATSGELTFINAPDYEEETTYTASVSVSDGIN